MQDEPKSPVDGLEDDRLPWWMTTRMMTDQWVFGLMLSTGVTLV